jgi:hypothetical protein
MALSSLTNRNNYTGNGSLSSYSYSYRIQDQTHLRVTVMDTNDVETLLTLTTDYTVSGVGGASGGSITLVNASQAWLTSGHLKSGYRITIRRVLPLKQNNDIRNSGDFFAATHEDEFDYLTMVDQQLQDQLDRTVQLPETTALSGLTLPEPEAGMVLQWNDDEDGLQNLDPDSAAALTVVAPASAFSTATIAQSVLDALNPRIYGTRGAPSALLAGTALAPTAGVIEQTHFIQGSGGAVDVSANPQIAAGTVVGQKLRLIACSNTNTVKYENGTGLILNGDYTMISSSLLALIWDGTNWVEEYRNALI